MANITENTQLLGESQNKLTTSKTITECLDYVTDIKLYKRRWYIFVCFTMYNFMQYYLSVVWTVIAVSIRPLFGWSNAEIALMTSWYGFEYIVLVVPVSWVMQKKGLRLSIVTTAGLVFLGCILRCASLHAPAVTWLNQISFCLMGLSEPVSLAAGPVISSAWFPVNERSTVTSVFQTAGFLGLGVAYIVGPLYVSAPKPVTSYIQNSSIPVRYSNLDQIRNQVLTLRATECVIFGLLFVSMLIYFPSKPPKPPTQSSAQPRVDYLTGLKTLFRCSSYNFWLLCLVQSMSLAVYDYWGTLLTLNFGRFLSQNQIGYLGFISHLSGAVAAVFAGRLADFFMGRMKLISVLFLSMAIFSTFWVLLLTMQYIPMSLVQLYIALIVQAFTVWAPVGLYFEMSIEATYPIPEAVTCSVMPVVYNIFVIAFLFQFFIPNIGVSWMNWFLYSSLLICLPLLMAFKEDYKRLAVDIHSLS